MGKGLNDLLCVCGDYHPYRDSIQGRVVAAMMPMDACVNCITERTTISNLISVGKPLTLEVFREWYNKKTQKAMRSEMSRVMLEVYPLPTPERLEYCTHNDSWRYRE